MAAITGHAVAAVLAAAEINSFRFLRLEFFRCKLAALVAAIAEWLGRALATRAEPITFAFLYFDGIGALLGDDGFRIGHDFP